ncbi:UPF0547 protein C16orf87 homolog isoform X2 [Mizuhopecten yessoensis]|uniref:UPF0547 protein C16orf87 homolog isoform X2 n=1 Tax=Mizuhopecten yessoensis TaxID=6573 RepID=UPI000B45EFB5|nr:UPF0547 protein C16orf87 homolog isoform X2 [Mizuhopecten yessoensis]
MPRIVRKKSFDRTVVKKCPKCDQQIPVACKHCPCGHQFSKKPSTPTEEEQASFKIRRTERTRRERPDFFNPMVLDVQAKRARKKSQNSPQVQVVETPPPPPPPPPPPVQVEKETPSRKRRGRPKQTPTKSVSEPEEKPLPVEDDVFVKLCPEKALQFSIILSDLNRKFGSQNFQPL